ncbi:MAG: ThiF family adenylyltransferase [Candidatus Hodarchaeota archaeon]
MSPTGEESIFSNFSSESISVEERKLLDRQMRLPGWNQQVLKESRVLIVGVGGLGCEVAKNLAMAGVGTLHLVDLDLIEYSNLNRQILFIGAHNEGRPKAIVAAEKLKEINPYGNYFGYHCALEELSPELFEEVDLVVAGLDSVQARANLNRKCVHANVPMIDAGTSTYYAHVYTIFPGKNACLECDPQTEREQERLAACTLVGIPRKRAHCVLKGQLFFESKHNRPPDIFSREEMQIVLDYANDLAKTHFPQDPLFGYDETVSLVDQHEPSVITLNAVVAAIQSQEAIKILHHQGGKGIGTMLTQYMVYNSLTGKFYTFDKPQNPKCLLCGPERMPLIEVTISSSQETLNQTLSRLCQDQGWEIDAEFPPIFTRIDSRYLEELELDKTVNQLKIRNKETLLLVGLDDGEFYVKIILKKSE